MYFKEKQRIRSLKDPQSAEGGSVIVCPTLADLGVAGEHRQSVGQYAVDEHPRVAKRLVVERFRVREFYFVYGYAPPRSFSFSIVNTSLLC